MVYSIAEQTNWADIKQEYKQRGVVTIDTGLSGDMLDELGRKLNHWFDDDAYPTTDVASIKPNRVQDAWRYEPAVKEIARQKEVLDLLAYIYDEAPLPFQTLNFQKGTEQSIHSDSIHFNSEPFGMMCGVWLALEDIGQDQGPLQFYPNSHELPEMNFEDIGIEPTPGDYSQYNQFIRELIAEKNMQPEFGVLKKGQAIVWAANLLHGGSKRESNKSRLSQVTHYYFDNSKYWRPSLSISERYYYEPRWITEQVGAHSTASQDSFFKRAIRKLSRSVKGS